MLDNQSIVSPLRRKIALPPAVAAIYVAVEELERTYPGRKFTPDGHLVGSIGEAIVSFANPPGARV